MKTELVVEGMSCSACVNHVKKALEAIPGVDSAVVELEAGRAVVTQENVSVDTLLAAIEEEGYTARPVAQN